MGTGYGNQTEVTVQALRRQLGHELTVSAFYGLQGTLLELDDLPILPGGADAFGNDVLPGHKDKASADIVITLMDLEALNPDVLEMLDCVYAWIPVDHDPVQDGLVEMAQHTKGIIAMSRFGYQQLAAKGVHCYYIPHSIDSQVYFPVDREEARTSLGLPEDAFIVSMVLANKGAPSRKAFDQQIRAFAAFRAKQPSAFLYLHTRKMAVGGEDIEKILALNHVPADRVKFAPQYLYSTGMLDHKYMRYVYSASDVLMNATRGEGFGIPIMEAQMCGCPVIVTNFSAMPELVYTGWVVPWVDKTYTGWKSYQVIPSVKGITDALQQAYSIRGDEDLRREARERVMHYDTAQVVEKYWKPVLEHIELTRQEPAAAEIPAVEETGSNGREPEEVREQGLGLSLEMGGAR